MNETYFVVLFNVMDSGYKEWLFPTLACAYLAFACSLPILVKRGFLPKVNGRVICLLALVLILILLNGFFTTRHYLMYRDALKSGHTSFVEGTVADLKTLPKQESFSVNGIRFSYSDSIIPEGFNHMSSNGGPIRQGLYVRIWYAGNVILKLEAKS